MFVDYFKLAKQPFGSTPDPSFLFQGDSHREALASLYCGFYGNRGFTALIAEPGMGKTTLLFRVSGSHSREVRPSFQHTLRPQRLAFTYSARPRYYAKSKRCGAVSYS